MMPFNFFSKTTHTYKTRHTGTVKNGEDGLACIAMIFSSKENGLSLSELRSLYPQFISEISLRDIIEILHSHGLPSKALHCTIHELRKITLPCILHWNMRQFVVLVSISDSTFAILDPLNKKTIYKIDEFSRYYNDIVLEILPQH